MNIAGSCHGMIRCGSLSAFSGADLVVIILLIIILLVIAGVLSNKKD